MKANDITREFLIDKANKHFAQYPQYKDYHNDWALGLTTKTLKYKGGDIPANTLVLVKVRDFSWATLLNFDNFHHCALDDACLLTIEFLA